MNKPKLIYVAGPYRANTEEQKQVNIKVARDAGAELMRRGYVPFIPHSMTADFDIDYPDIDDDVYIQTDLCWLRLCDGILMLPNWEDSLGARIEFEVAVHLGKAVYSEVPE